MVNHDKANTILVLGILGLTVCGICGPVAWLMGNSYVASCREAGVEPQSAGTTGRLLGMISTGLMGLALVLFFVAIVLQVVVVVLSGA